VLSGGLAGHVHGTAVYDVTSTGEPPGWRPYIWEALRYASGGQMALLYFERKAVLPRVGGLEPGARYRWTWFDPRAGGWAAATELVAGADGVLGAPPFPEDAGPAVQDWAAKLTRVSIPSGPTLKSRPGRALSRPLG
jgi:hypothetical protein